MNFNKKRFMTFLSTKNAIIANLNKNIYNSKEPELIQRKKSK